MELWCKLPTYESACEVREQPGLANYSLRFKSPYFVWAGYTNRTGLPMFDRLYGTKLGLFGLASSRGRLQLLGTFLRVGLEAQKMNTIQTRPRMKFHSRGTKRRLSLYFMCFVLIMGWTVLPLMLALTYSSIQHDLASGFAAVLIAFTITVFLLVSTRQFLKISTCDGFELLIESDIIFLHGVDNKQNKRLWREVPLSSVEEADYYPTSDGSTIVLHSKGRPDLELPLWAFGRDAEAKIVEYIRRRTRVIDIPSAIVI